MAGHEAAVSRARLADAVCRMPVPTPGPDRLLQDILSLIKTSKAPRPGTPQPDRLLRDILSLIETGKGQTLCEAFAAVEARDRDRETAQGATGQVRVAAVGEGLIKPFTGTAGGAPWAAGGFLDAVVVLIAEASVACGRSRWRLDWAGRTGLPRPDTWGDAGYDELAALVDAVVRQPEELPGLLARLAALGVDPDIPVVSTFLPRRPADAAADNSAIELRIRRNRRGGWISTLVGLAATVAAVHGINHIHIHTFPQEPQIYQPNPTYLPLYPPVSPYLAP